MLLTLAPCSCSNNLACSCIRGQVSGVNPDGGGHGRACGWTFRLGGNMKSLPSGRQHFFHQGAKVLRATVLLEKNSRISRLCCTSQCDLHLLWKFKHILSNLQALMKSWWTTETLVPVNDCSWQEGSKHDPDEWQSRASGRGDFINYPSSGASSRAVNNNSPVTLKTGRLF